MLDIFSKFNNLRAMSSGRATSGRSAKGCLQVVLLALLVTAELAAQAGYGGPSMLSRGGNRPGRRGQAPADFSFYVGARGTAEQGLIVPSLTAEGGVDPVTAYGGSGEVGLYGGRDWNHGAFGVDYRGDYRYNTRNKAFNGLNQALSMDVQVEPTRRLTVFFKGTGGTSNRAFGGFAAPAFSQLDRYGVPLGEVFDTRTYFAQSLGGVGYRLSARTTVVAQGGGFFIKRENASLINGQGYSAGLTLSRRFSRRTEVGVVYQYVRFEFPRVFSTSSSQGVGLRLVRTLNRKWEASATLGTYRVASTGTQEVTLSPEVAFILGRTSGVQAFSLVRYVPMIQAEVTYTQPRGRLSFGAMSGIGNGNGVYQGTRNESVRAGYSYSGLRRIALGVSAGYTRTSSVSVTLSGIEAYQGGGGISYQIAEHLNFNAQLDYRKFNSTGLRGREGAAASVGLSYTSSRLPISIW